MRKPVYVICEQQRRWSACLISAFVVRCLDSIIPLLAIVEISRLDSFWSCLGRFESDLVENHEDGFSHDVVYLTRWMPPPGYHRSRSATLQIANRHPDNLFFCSDTLGADFLVIWVGTAMWRANSINPSKMHRGIHSEIMQFFSNVHSLPSPVSLLKPEALPGRPGAHVPLFPWNWDQHSTFQPEILIVLFP